MLGILGSDLFRKLEFIIDEELILVRFIEECLGKAGMEG